MTTILIIYLFFGLGLSISSKTNIMSNEKWYMQALYPFAYPVFLYILAIKTARLAVKLTEMMDEQPKVVDKTMKYDFLEQPEVPGVRTGSKVFVGTGGDLPGCSRFDTKPPEPKCGQDMLESYAFDYLLYAFKKSTDNEAKTIEDIKAFIRQYTSPFV